MSARTALCSNCNYTPLSASVYVRLSAANENGNGILVMFAVMFNAPRIISMTHYGA